MPFYNEGVMGNDIEIMADIIFDDDCLLYFVRARHGRELSEGKGVSSLRAEALRRTSVRKGLKAGAQSTIEVKKAASNPLIKKGGYHE